MSAEADESLILTVFFLSGCTNPNRRYLRSRREQQATSFLLNFLIFLLSFQLELNFNVASKYRPCNSQSYVSGKCKHYIILKQTLSTVLKTFASTTTNNSKTLSVNITLQPNSSTCGTVFVCLSVCFAAPQYG